MISLPCVFSSSNLQPKLREQENTRYICLFKSSYIAPFRQVIPWQWKLSALSLGVLMWWYCFSWQNLVASCKIRLNFLGWFSCVVLLHKFSYSLLADISQNELFCVLVFVDCKILYYWQTPILLGVPVILNHRYIEVVPAQNFQWLSAEEILQAKWLQCRKVQTAVPSGIS